MERRNRFLLGFMVFAMAFSPVEAAQPPIRIGVIDDQLPCSDVHGQTFRGSSVDLWHQVSNRINRSFTFLPIRSAEEGIRQANAGELDLVVSCLNITPTRIQQVRFTTPFSEDGLALLSRKSEPSFAKTLKQVLESKVIRETIALLFLGGLAFAILLWFLSREFQHRDIVGDNKRQTFYKGWMMLAMGTGIYKMGTAPPSMTVIAISNFARLVITSIFVASTTTLVIRETTPNDISGPQFLRNALTHKIGVDQGSFAEAWLDRNADSLISAQDQIKAIIPITNSDDMIKQLESGNVGSLLADFSTIEILKNKLDHPGDYEIIGETFYYTPQAFAASPTLDFKSLDAINEVLSELRFDGEADAIIERWKSRKKS